MDSLSTNRTVECGERFSPSFSLLHYYLTWSSFWFQRELENNPHIVVKDMQFNVLQALIEFMYYGETRITEENFTSLIEAAKLFEVRQLLMRIIQFRRLVAESSTSKRRNNRPSFHSQVIIRWNWDHRFFCILIRSLQNPSDVLEYNFLVYCGRFLLVRNLHYFWTVVRNAHRTRSWVIEELKWCMSQKKSFFSYQNQFSQSRW